MSRRTDSDNRSHDDRAAAWMAEATRLTVGSRPHPNPRVGAVVFAADGSRVAAARHEGPGLPHAEAAALGEAGTRAEGATLVVTLEPCNHQGRTPACTEAIVAAGIDTVIVGARDPDPRVNGSGIARLHEAGIEVIELEDGAARAVDPGYFHHRETGRPWVTLKVAMTLDGQVAAGDGSSQWITGEPARLDGHRLRAAADAILVGAGTVIADDPRLDVRLAGFAGEHPRPVIVVGERALPPTAGVLARNPLVYAAAPLDLEAETVVVGGADGVDLDAVMKDLGSRGLIEVLVEGGPRLAASLLRRGLVDRLVVYAAAKLAGGAGLGVFAAPFATLDDARPVRISAVEYIGDDLRIEAVTNGGER